MDYTLNEEELKLTPEELIDELPKTHFVTIFAKSYCKYSKRVKAFFKNKHIDFKAVDLDLLGDHGKEIQDKLLEKTGQSTVPNVWVKGKFIGENVFFNYIIKPKGRILGYSLD